jgi:site-specific DNA recombinase
MPAGLAMRLSSLLQRADAGSRRRRRAVIHQGDHSLMIAAAIYARKSTDQHVATEEKSVTRQLEQAKVYAARHGWTVLEEHCYVDDGVSGAEFAKRPGLVALLNALKPRPPFQVLLLYDSDRLGREQNETAYIMKRLSQAGVAIHETKDGGRELLAAVLAGASEIERAKARTRTRDALARKAARGYVAGGRCFGYTNVVVSDTAGRRAHVVRQINAEEAAVVRRIFTLAAEGHGLKKLAHQLNCEQALAPIPGRGGVRGWAPSSIREILHRELYRGVVVWGRKRKRDQWGQRHVTHADKAEWVRHPDETLRIVPEALWQAAQARIAETRHVYLRGAEGTLWGRPASGIESKYLLTGFARCGSCGGTMEVRRLDWRHTRTKGPFYQCASYVRRGLSICDNTLALPLALADAEVLDAIEANVLHPSVVRDAIREAIDEMRRPTTIDPAHSATLKDETRHIDNQLANLTRAVKLGGSLPVLVAEIQSLERRKAEIQRVVTPTPVAFVDVAKLEALMRQWREMFRSNVAMARQILRELLAGERVVFTPRPEARRYDFVAPCTLDRISATLGAPQRLVAPRGFVTFCNPVDPWGRPPAGSLEECERSAGSKPRGGFDGLWEAKIRGVVRRKAV